VEARRVAAAVGMDVTAAATATATATTMRSLFVRFDYPNPLDELRERAGRTIHGWLSGCDRNVVSYCSLTISGCSLGPQFSQKRPTGACTSAQSHFTNGCHDRSREYCRWYLRSRCGSCGCA